jgi:outer membrane protein TolC
MRSWKLLWLMLGGWCSAASALTLDEALQRAGQAPDIVASSADNAALAAMRIAAGRLPDPRLQFSLDDFPTEGEGRYRLSDAKRMVSLMQEIPAAAKRDAQIRQAEAAMEASGREREFVSLAVRREATLAWVRLYFLEQKRAVLEQQAIELRRRQDTTRTALAGGGAADEALDALIDEQDLRDAFDALARDIRLARANLVRWTGELPLSETATGDLPSWLANTAAGATKSGANEDENAAIPTELRASQARIRMAQAEVAMAEADTASDWSVEFGVGQDAMGNGMVMAKVGISLPLFGATRQAPKIAAARRMLEKSDAEHAMRRAEFLRQQAELEAEETVLEARLHRLEGETLPLIARKVALAEAAFSAGQGSAAAFIMVREKRLATQGDAIELAGERAAVRVKLHYLRHRGEEASDE